MPALTEAEHDDVFRCASTAQSGLIGAESRRMHAARCTDSLSAMTTLRLMAAGRAARATSDDVLVATLFRLPRMLAYEVRFFTLPISFILGVHPGLCMMLRARMCLPNTELGRLDLVHYIVDVSAEMVD